ncbi:hypothetical protein [Fodinibius sp.]|uniref:hypothetical protein n=1 Tax=Fodinibius sp. TaxID=1872440 RepID=UPI002ACE5A53|nr:hypothetical protein [Fodinibius sp.]MDZ7658089.1 hypothetical protein [Fodinibius sp.]
MSIETSCLPREIQLGDRKVRVRPPTVRQAVEILHVLQNMEDDEDVRLLMQQVRKLDWLGGIDIIVHLRNQMHGDPFAFSTLLKDIILQGYDPEKQTKKAKESDEEDIPREVDWKRLLSEYCRAYPGREPFKVWDEIPFPFFMEMLPEARKEEARQHINSAFEASFAMGGSEKMMETWQEKAGFETQKEQKESEYTEDIPQEELHKEREALKDKLM